MYVNCIFFWDYNVTFYYICIWHVLWNLSGSKITMSKQRGDNLNKYLPYFQFVLYRGRLKNGNVHTKGRFALSRELKEWIFMQLMINAIYSINYWNNMENSFIWLEQNNSHSLLLKELFNILSNNNRLIIMLTLKL